MRKHSLCGARKHFCIFCSREGRIAFNISVASLDSSHWEWREECFGAYWKTSFEWRKTWFHRPLIRSASCIGLCTNCKSVPMGVLEVGISRHHMALHLLSSDSQLPSTNEMMHQKAALTHYWSLSTAASATPALQRLHLLISLKILSLLNQCGNSFLCLFLFSVVLDPMGHFLMLSIISNKQ